MTEGRYNHSRDMIIACATIMEEIRPLIPEAASCRILDFGLHVKPDALKESLQNAVDSAPDNIDRIILGYGLCSQAVTDLKSEKCTLIVPKADDCITVFLGSVASYRREHQKHPGTYYVTKGWLKTASTTFDQFEGMVRQYGYEKANRIMGLMLKNYTRLGFISTGLSDSESYQVKAKAMAEKFGLEYEEIQGSPRLIKKLIFGPWDDEIIVVNPGETIKFEHFR